VIVGARHTRRDRRTADAWEQEATFQHAAAKDKTIVKIEGADHAWNPSGPKAGDGKQRERMLDALFGWLGQRFPGGGTAPAAR
jgi:dienelactone hydrolase